LSYKKVIEVNELTQITPCKLKGFIMIVLFRTAFKKLGRLPRVIGYEVDGTIGNILASTG
jgi:hypothetical protein